MKAVLVLGSNHGDRMGNIKKAIEYVGNVSTVVELSEIYESPDCLGSGKKYLNAVLVIETAMEENALNCKFKMYEERNGRNEMMRNIGEVPIDIDIVIVGEAVRRPKDFNSAYFKKGFERLTPFGTVSR